MAKFTYTADGKNSATFVADLRSRGRLDVKFDFAREMEVVPEIAVVVKGDVSNYEVVVDFSYGPAEVGARGDPTHYFKLLDEVEAAVSELPGVRRLPTTGGPRAYFAYTSERTGAAGELQAAEVGDKILAKAYGTFKEYQPIAAKE